MHLFVDLVGQAVHVGFLRHGHAEFGVEHGHVGHAGEELFGHFDAHEVGGVVQGAQGEAVTDDLLHVFVHLHGLGDGFAAVQHAVADGVDLALVLDDALFRVGQQGDDQFHGFHVGGEGAFAHDLFFVVAVRSDLVGQLAHALADAFGQTGSQDGLGVHFQQLIFAGGRASVDNQYFHEDPRQGGMEGRSLGSVPDMVVADRMPGEAGACPYYFCFSAAAWMAVMATVFTISGTVQPRDRSLTGLLRPCRTGPMATASAARCTAL